MAAIANYSAMPDFFLPSGNWYSVRTEGRPESMSFHKLDKARDKNFWSVRVSSDIRSIVHKTSVSLLLCYVDHLDKAYQ